MASFWHTSKQRRMHKYSGSITELLKIDYPVIAGGMAWVSNASLAAAVSKAGGLGVIAAGNAPADWVREQIKLVRQETDKPFGVNIIMVSPNVQEVAQIVAQEHVPVVITGAGNPAQYVKAWKAAGCIVAPVVASRALAIRLERKGVDFLVAEGNEAGGHIGELTTMVLMPTIVKSVQIPVVAAGGIFDASTVAAAFCLGAAGVQVGTRFILASECTAHDEYKRRLIKAKDIDSKVTGRVTGHPVRLLRSPIVREMAKAEYEENAVMKLEALGEGSLQCAATTGDKDKGSFMAGQCAGLLDKEQTAKEIIEELFDEKALADIAKNLNSKLF